MALTRGGVLLCLYFVEMWRYEMEMEGVWGHWRLENAAGVHDGWYIDTKYINQP